MHLGRIAVTATSCRKGLNYNYHEITPQSRLGGVEVSAEQQVLRNEVQSYSHSLTQRGREREAVEGSGACGSFLPES